jgi:hypothetical protein
MNRVERGAGHGGEGGHRARRAAYLRPARCLAHLKRAHRTAERSQRLGITGGVWQIRYLVLVCHIIAVGDGADNIIRARNTAHKRRVGLSIRVCIGIGVAACLKCSVAPGTDDRDEWLRL